MKVHATTHAPVHHAPHVVPMWSPQPGGHTTYRYLRARDTVVPIRAHTPTELDFLWCADDGYRGSLRLTGSQATKQAKVTPASRSQA